MSMAVDRGGNAYVAADSWVFGAERLLDCRVLKFDPAGAQIGNVRIDHAQCAAIAVNASGNAYVAGGTSNFLPTAPPFQPTAGALQMPGATLFLAKLNTAANAVVYSARFGTNDAGAIGPSDQVSALAVDAAGNAYVAGGTRSAEFPATPGVFQERHNPLGPGISDQDAFVAKISPDGSRLIYATLLGGADADHINAIAVNAFGQVYVAGQTSSRDFPTTPGAYQPSNGVPGIGSNAFVAQLAADGSALVYSTAFQAVLSANALAVDGDGNAFFSGAASVAVPTVHAIQPGYPATTCPSFDEHNNVIAYYIACPQAIVVGFNPTGTGLVLSTYLSGRNIPAVSSGGRVPSGSLVGGAAANALALDSAGNLIVAGQGRLHLAALNPKWNFGTAFAAAINPRAAPPQFSAETIVNTADQRPGGVREGGLLTIFCTGLTGIRGAVKAPPDALPTQLAGVSVIVDGTLAPLLAVTDFGAYQQIDLQVPALPEQPPLYEYGDEIYVIQNGQFAFLPNLNLQLAPPGIFVADGVHALAVHSSDFTLVDAAHPAMPGELITFYANGLGRLDPPLTYGRPAPPSAYPLSFAFPVTVTVQGLPAQTLFAGSGPRLLGVNQVNIRLPDQLKGGDADLVISLSAYLEPAEPLSDGRLNTIYPASKPAKISIQGPATASGR